MTYTLQQWIEVGVWVIDIFGLKKKEKKILFFFLNELIGHLKNYEIQLEPRVFLLGLSVLEIVCSSHNLRLLRSSRVTDHLRHVPRPLPSLSKASSYPKKDKAIHEKVQKMPRSKCSAPPTPTLVVYNPVEDATLQTKSSQWKE